MQTLQIFENGGQWYAVVSNTEVRYLFQGATTAEQFKNTQVFAEGMVRGEEGADAVMDHVLDIGETSPADVMQELFGTTDKIMLNENVIWATVDEEDTVLTELEEAGEILAEFLEALAA